MKAPRGWKPWWPKWKTEARILQERSRAIFLPQIKRAEDGEELVIVGNGKGKLPTYYLRDPRDGGPTMPYKKVVL